MGRVRLVRRPIAAAIIAFALAAARNTSPSSSSQPLALSPLDKPRSAFLEDVLEGSSANQKYCKLSGEIQDACCDYATVEQTNDRLFQALHDMVTLPFFRYHKVDLYKECPFWHEDGSCMNRACGVETADEEDVPEQWRSHALGQIKTVSESLVNETTSLRRDDDFCVLEDELDSQGVFVDLVENPERFTGYAGPSSSKVWKAIYEENCFAPVPFVDPSRATTEGGTGFASLNSFGMIKQPSASSGWGESEKRLIGNLAGPRDAEDEICLEKRVFYRIISGLHASISIHICDDYLDQTTGNWGPNLECFITRIGQHPERLQNVYFAYVLSLRALERGGRHLQRALDEYSADDSAKIAFQSLLTSSECPGTFDETSMFSGPSANILKTEFKSHFRNISQIMDCVGCDKCRLWGKLQITGLGTALKLLFSAEQDEKLVLSRGEVVTFVNTLHRLSESLAAVEKFRALWAARRSRGPQTDVAPEADTDTLEDGRFKEIHATDAPRSSTNVSDQSDRASDRSVWQYLVGFCKNGWTKCIDLTGYQRRRALTEL